MTLARLRLLPAAFLLTLTAAALAVAAVPGPAGAATGRFAGMHPARTADEKTAVRTVRAYNAALVDRDGDAVCRLHTKTGRRTAVLTAAMWYGTRRDATCAEATNAVCRKLERYGSIATPMRQPRVKMLPRKKARVGFRTVGKVVRGTTVAPTRQWVELVKKDGAWRLTGAGGTRTL